MQVAYAHSFIRTKRQKISQASDGFHHARLASQSTATKLPQLPVKIRPAECVEELSLAATLRARSFYAYPPERAFAGKLHQDMKATEELAALIERRKAPATRDRRNVCLVAVAEPPGIPDHPAYQDTAGSMPALGTVDLLLQASLQQEYLKGNSMRPAYLASFCVAEAARRQGVGSKMIDVAYVLAKSWGADVLYVHMMAANTAGRAFYESKGFVLDQQESSNHAHYRGQCLDGVNGAARTILLRRKVEMPLWE